MSIQETLQKRFDPTAAIVNINEYLQSLSSLYRSAVSSVSETLTKRFDPTAAIVSVSESLVRETVSYHHSVVLSVSESLEQEQVIELVETISVSASLTIMKQLIEEIGVSAGYSVVKAPQLPERLPPTYIPAIVVWLFLFVLAVGVAFAIAMMTRTGMAGGLVASFIIIALMVAANLLPQWILVILMLMLGIYVWVRR